MQQHYDCYDCYAFIFKMWFGYFPLLNGFLRGSLTGRSPESTWCHKKKAKKNKWSVCCEYTFWHGCAPPRRCAFGSSRQLCQTVGELLTLTGSDEAAQADVFLFALGETASLTLSRLILGPGLSQCWCLYLPLCTLSLRGGVGGGCLWLLVCSLVSFLGGKTLHALSQEMFLSICRW